MRDMPFQYIDKAKDIVYRAEEQRSLAGSAIEEDFIIWRDTLRLQIGERVECLLEDLCAAAEVTKELGLHAVCDADGAVGWLHAFPDYLAAGSMTADGQAQERWVSTDALRMVDANESEIIWLTGSLDLLKNDGQILERMGQFLHVRYVLLANTMISKERCDNLKQLLVQKGQRGIEVAYKRSHLLLIDREPQKYSGQLCVYVVTHKKFTPPINELYQPIHAGRAGGDDVGYPGDSTGDNISRWNSKLNELTAFYWIWKNDQHPYVGINQYRRYFAWKGLHGACDPADEEFLLCNLQTCDILVWEPLYTAPLTVEWQLEQTLPNENVWRIVKDVLQEKLKKYQPDYEKSFLDVMRGYIFIPRNVFVTSKRIFDEYCEWLFSFLLEATVDIEGRETREERDSCPRLMGFVAERLFSVWLRKHSYRARSIHGYFIGDTAT